MCLTDVTEHPECAQGSSGPGNMAGQGCLSPVPMSQILSYSHMQELGDRDLEIILLNNL